MSLARLANRQLGSIRDGPLPMALPPRVCLVRKVTSCLPCANEAITPRSKRCVGLHVTAALPPARQPPSSSSSPLQPLPAGNGFFSFWCNSGVMALIVLNAAIFAVRYFHVGGRAEAVASSLALDSAPGLKLAFKSVGCAWWQLLTSAFAHSSLEHLARNAFLVHLFGGVVRRELGTSFGVWFTYLLCAFGANISSLWLAPGPAYVSGSMLGIAATGGAVGLFLVSLLLSVRVSLNWLVGAAVTSFWVLQSVLRMPVPGGPVGHAGLQSALHLGRLGPVIDVAVKNSSLHHPLGLEWLWGVAVGAVFVAILAKIPDPDAQQPSVPARPL